MDSNAAPPDVVAFLATPKGRTVFVEATVVVACDRSSPGHQTLFYGRTEVEAVSKLGRGGFTALTLSYDSRDTSLEYLYAACLVLKGSCDYRDALQEARFLGEMKESWGGSPAPHSGEAADE